jgi:hypothetical protein
MLNESLGNERCQDFAIRPLLNCQPAGFKTRGHLILHVHEQDTVKNIILQIFRQSALIMIFPARLSTVNNGKIIMVSIIRRRKI